MRSHISKRNPKSRWVRRRRLLPPWSRHALDGLASRRGGAVIIVVLALLMTLLFLGLFQYRWTGQELANAQQYAESPVASSTGEIDCNPIFADALRQLIVGVPDGYEDSALNATDSTVPALLGNPSLQPNISLWSMLANQLGPIHSSGVPLDMQLHNGQGIRVDATSPLVFALDYNQDGTPDQLRLHYGRTANGGANFDLVANPGYVFQPDAGYTYADLNSLFLAMDYIDPATGARVIKPSFTAPAYLPAERAAADYSAIYTTLGRVSQVLRPHLYQGYVAPGSLTVPNLAAPTVADNVNRRYLIAATTAASGDRQRVIPPYDFAGGTWGVYQGVSTYDLDGDADGDGIDDSVDLDLGHGIIDLPGGRQVVPIFHIKVVDQDALLNTNAVGNQSLLTLLSNNAIATPAFAYLPNFWLHSSNMGIARSEINPQFALQADASNVNYVDAADVNWATAPLRAWVANRTGANPVDITGGSLSRLQSANIELARMLYGAPDFFADDLRYAGTSDLEGRYGTDNAGVVSVRNFLGDSTPTNGVVPSPGEWARDDDRNSWTPAAFPPTDYAYRRNGHGGRAYLDATSPLPNVPIPPFVHPLDYTGLAGLIAQVGSGNDQRLVAKIDANSPVNWPQYPAANLGAFGMTGFEDLHSNQGAETVTFLNDISGDTYADLGFKVWKDAIALQLGAANDQLLNNVGEMNLYTDLGPGSDNTFSVSEIASLQLSDSDWSRLGAVSRLRKLLPLNFENNKQASFIRGHFTTSSWDRLEFGMSRFASTTERLWEFNNPIDLTADGLAIYDAFPPRFGAVGASRQDTGVIVAQDPFRPELRRLLTSFAPGELVPDAVRNRFPRHRININRILSDDRLTTGLAGFNAFDAYGNPLYRELVPHVVTPTDISAAQAVIVNTAMVHDNLTSAAYTALPATHPIKSFNIIGQPVGTEPDALAVQEWWARYDRQRLARDIYVLLYTLGGEDNVDPTTAAHDPLFAKQMAQFAVNYVDALDRDDCITRFEYDENLSDGWNSPTEAVFGIEQQQLTFSEGLLVDAPEQASDFATTLHDDTGSDHRWLYLEVRNVSPFPVKITQGFRVLRLNATAAPEVPLVAAEFKPRNATQHKEIQAGHNFLLAGHDGTVVNGAGQPIGSEFVVDYTGGTELEYVIPRGVTANTLLNNSERPDPAVFKSIDFDLTAYDDGNPATAEDYEFVDWTPPLDASWLGTTWVEADRPNEKATFSLQRRRNPYLTWTNGGASAIGTDDDAEWVEVDRMSLTELDRWDGSAVGMRFQPPTNGQAQNATALENLRSMERDHHFTFALHAHPVTPVSQQNFSLYQRLAAGNLKHAANDYIVASPPTSIADPANMNIWQPHFDRDFSSAIELLSLPLYGYRGGQDFTADPLPPSATGTPFVTVPVPTGGVTMNLMNNTADNEVGRYAAYHTAQMRFLFPSGDSGAGHPFNGKSSDGDFPNRWYRLFEFLQIPDMSDDVVETALRYKRRTPGKINPNTVRHEAVWAGLIDDDTHHNGIANPNRPTTDLLDAGRIWMDELQVARDRDIVAIPGFGNLALPGSPISRPFRPLSYVNPAEPEDSVSDTLLRLSVDNPLTVPTDVDTIGLLEARPTSDVGTEAIDPHTRNRLLAKVANNTTVRSHVFGVWIGFELHEAHQTAAGQVQIGGKATDLPGYRMFCVVDMSRLEEAYDPINGTFDFRKFIVHQQLLP